MTTNVLTRNRPLLSSATSRLIAAVCLTACGGEGTEKPTVDGDAASPISASNKLESGIRISSELADDLVQSRTAVIAVQVHLANTPRAANDPEIEEYGSAIVEHGETVEATLNGAPATPEDFADVAIEQRRVIAQRYAAQRAERSRQWTTLGQKYGVTDALARAIELGLSSAELDVSPQLAVELSRDDSRSVRALERRIPGTRSISSALSSIELSTSAHPAGWRGDGLGIFLSDFGSVDTTDSCVNTSRYAAAAGTVGPNEDHATLMACLLQAAAPGAEVLYRTAYGDCGADIAPEALDYDPPIFVSSQSDNWASDREYYACDGAFDNRVLDTRIAHFNSTSNSGGNVASPAVAYNVISVGNYDDAASPDTMVSSSAYVDPFTGASKPEIVAPGSDVDIDGFPNSGGTSVSTPLAAAFATDLMEQLSFLRGRPQVLKPYLMANAVRIDSDGQVTGEKDGAGRLDYSNANAGDGSTAGWSYWWNGSNGSHFTSDSDGDGRKEINVTRSMAAGTYHAVLNWLVSGDYVEANGTHNMDIDLAVMDASGTLLKASTSVLRTVESVRFTLAATTNITFKVERYWNSGIGPVAVGMVIRKR